MTIDISKFLAWMDRDFLPHYTESSYPRYNIIESGGNYRIEIALPGWKKMNWRYHRWRRTSVKG